MVHPGDVVPLSVEKPAAGGRMIARRDGQVVLVGGAIPGERVRARIARVARGLAYAETIAVDEPSPDRRDWGGDALCGGCVYGHIAYPRQLEIKSAVIADAFARIGRLPLASAVRVAASPEEAYRMRARLHVRGGRWGFFREGSHDLCDARQTRQLRGDTCDAVNGLVRAAGSLGLESIHEIELAENADCSNRAAFLDSETAIGGPALDRLAGCAGFTGIAAEAVRGNAYVTDVVDVAGRVLHLRRHVQAFFQGNRFLLPALAGRVVEELPDGGEVVDLYAGGGLFSTAAAAVRGARVTAIEGDRVAAADLQYNASTVEGVTAIHRPVEAYVARGFGGASGSATAIVDPPRTGMSREAADGILRARPSRLVYVSCDVATLARDARRFVDAGYALGRVDAFDLFPNTPHVETVAVFDAARTT